MLKVKLMVGGDGEGMLSDGSLPFSLVCAANTNLTLVKNAPGKLISIHAINVAAAIRYLKFYDQPNKPSIAGSGTPARRFGIPAQTTGAGFVLAPIVPMRFLAGIAFTITTGSADSDNTAPAAGDVILNLEFV